MQLVVPYEAPPNYHSLWLDVAACAEYNTTESALNTIQFYQINAPTFMAKGVAGRIAYAYVERNEIYVVREYKQDLEVISHEMLHFVLYWRDEEYDGGHPLKYRKCVKLE
jgi:hypothetical protein